MSTPEPGHEPLACARPQVQRDDGHAGRTGGRDRGQGGVEVLDGIESACPPVRCLARGGIGIAAIEDASLVLDGFTLARHATVGLYLGMGGVATHGIAPTLYARLPFNPRTDFSFITTLWWTGSSQSTWNR